MGTTGSFGLRLLFLSLELYQAPKAFPKSMEDGSSLVCSMASPHVLLKHTRVFWVPLGQQALVSAWARLAFPHQGHVSSKACGEHTLLCCRFGKCTHPRHQAVLSRGNSWVAYAPWLAGGRLKPKLTCVSLREQPVDCSLGLNK